MMENYYTSHETETTYIILCTRINVLRFYEYSNYYFKYIGMCVYMCRYLFYVRPISYGVLSREGLRFTLNIGDIRHMSMTPAPSN